MSRFVPDRASFFDSIYLEVAPWDIGAAQPGLLSLFDRYPPADPVLDIGCGTGDLVFELARQGRTVVGIDLAEGAIAQASERAGRLDEVDRARLTFRVADGLRLSDLGREFGSVVDSGFFHVLESADRAVLAEQLARCLRPGGRYYVLAFAVEFPLPNTPIRVSEEELRLLFTSEAGWSILHIGPAEFQGRFASVQAIAACMERIR